MSQSLNQTLTLNERAAQLADSMAERSADLRLIVTEPPEGGRLIDCGSQAPGGLRAGLDLARVCLAGLADLAIVPGEVAGRSCPVIQVVTDHPVAACLASQYAGWRLSAGKFFAMGSGPFRSAAGKEPIFERIGCRESPGRVVGVLETRKPPPPEIVAEVARSCRVETGNVTLLMAPTASLAGGVQIVARSVETALHKLAELDFDLGRLVAGHGTAPLPPVARDDLTAIGRTNDAVLYGARVVLMVRGDDADLEAIGPRVPSSSSKDHGSPFLEVFQRYNCNFYDVDPMLFSPAEVVFQNVETGRSFRFGRVEPDVLARSFFADGPAPA